MPTATVIPFPTEKQRGYSIQAKTETEAEIWIYEDIGDEWFGGLSASQFVKDLKELGAVETITVHINSAGGNAFDGIAIYNVLKQHKARVVVHIDGLAASIASVIAMAGDEINIAENAMMMIHDGWVVAVGNADDLRAVADLLDKLSASIIKSYMTHASIDEEKIAELMAAETWMSSEEAIEYGLADQLTESLAIAAHSVPTKFKFKNTPKDFETDTPAEPKPAEVEDAPDPKVESDPLQDSPLNPDNFESRRKQRIDTTHGPLERSK